MGEAVAVRFDDSLPALARIVEKELGASALAHGVALRDVTGRLAFVAAAPIAEEDVERLSTELRRALGPYARADRAVVPFGDYGSSELLQERHVEVSLPNGVRVKLVDRRLVGADWLKPPVEAAPGPPRFVFASLKGGVGRSTALTVAAAHRAAQGERILAIDLDIEAPGLGAILLDDDTLPEFGVLDALVESQLGSLDERFLADLVGPSALAETRGGIDVAPAFGRRSRKNPADVLAKIARAYTEHVREDGAVVTLLDKVRALVDFFTERSRYDAIFVDARAGLHETAASAILGLGAEVFLFGIDERQTFQGYEALLGHMGRFVVSGGPAPEWFLRLTMVQGKAPLEREAREAFVERCRALFRRTGFGPAEPTSPADVPALDTVGALTWDDAIPDEQVLPDEEWVPRSPIAIAYDPQFQRFDPFERRDLLTDRVYRATFGDLLERIDEPFRARRSDP